MENLEKYPKLNTFSELPKGQRWEACISALENDYTLSFRGACRILKCNRAWVSRYIRPNCSHIYLSPGVSVGKSSPNYLRLAAARLGVDNLKDSIWFNRAEFENLIRENIVSCTRQTIVVPIEWLIEHDRILEYRNAYNAKMNEIKCTTDQAEINRLLKEKDELVIPYLNQVGRAIYDNKPNKYKRTATKGTKADMPEFELKDLHAVHDMKNYGDTDEEIYRDLFMEGACRLELKIPDQDGCVSKKIYYLYCDDGIDLENTIEKIPIAYEDYIRFFGAEG